MKSDDEDFVFLEIQECKCKCNYKWGSKKVNRTAIANFNWRSRNVTLIVIVFLEFQMLRELLAGTLRPRVSEEALGFVYEEERVVDDFVFMCMLVGNDSRAHLH